jgi:hypothetical protein
VKSSAKAPPGGGAAPVARGASAAAAVSGANARPTRRATARFVIGVVIGVVMAAPFRVRRARLGTTWAPVGRTPVRWRVSQRREVTTIAGLVAPLRGPARGYARHVRGSVRWPQLLAALRHFRRRPPGGRPAGVAVALRARAQPQGRCNGAVKPALRNAAPTPVDGLHRLGRRAFLRRDRRPRPAARLPPSHGAPCYPNYLRRMSSSSA